jgi:hypothetical protein
MDYPRVTEVLKPFSGFDYIPKDRLESAAKRGTEVHSICAGLAKGAWIPDSMIQEEYKGYIKSYNDWAKENITKCDIVEKRYVEHEHGYTGQIDLTFVHNDGKYYLCDIKTSAAYNKVHYLQMCAYYNMLFENEVIICGAYLLYLQKDGGKAKEKFIKLEDLAEDFFYFECALTCYKFFHKKKEKQIE